MHHSFDDAVTKKRCQRSGLSADVSMHRWQQQSHALERQGAGLADMAEALDNLEGVQAEPSGRAHAGDFPVHQQGNWAWPL